MNADPLTRPGSVHCLLRLLGFVRAASPTRGEWDSARRRLGLVLGLKGPVLHDDQWLIQRTRPILERLGLAADSLDREGPGNRLIAGILPSVGRSTRVCVESVSLGGKATTLAEVDATPTRLFLVSTSCPDGTLIRATFSSSDTLHRSIVSSAGADNWLSWPDVEAVQPSLGFFDVRHASIEACLATDNLSVEDVQDTASHSMSGAVAARTGLPLEWVVQHVLAARLAKRHAKVPASVFSALLGRPVRPGERRVRGQARDKRNRAPRLPVLSVTKDAADASEKRVSSNTRASLTTALKLQHDSGELSADDLRGLEQYVAALVVKRARTGSEHEARWYTMLLDTGLDAERAAKIAPLLSAKHTDELSAGDRAERVVELARLTDHDVSAVQALVDLTCRAVARLDGPRLRARLATTVDGLAAEKMQARIHELTDATYPGDALLRRRRPTLSEKAAKLLDAADDAFDLAATPIEKFVATGGGGTEVAAELLRLQRIIRVAPHARTAKAILDLGYASAMEIATSDVLAFVTRLSTAGIPPSDATRAHRKARGHHRAAVELYLRFNQSAAGPTLRPLPPIGAEAADAAQLDIPSYEALFGPQEVGIVPPSESVTGHAAYLVDLLVWSFKLHVAADKTNPYALLTTRRPEIRRLLLNEANSETLVPHIDLVCELLEDIAATRIDPTYKAEARQTRLTEKQIRAYPEYVEEKVYERLKTASAPMSLPFDLWLEEVRAYLPLVSSSGTPLSRKKLVSLLGTDIFDSWPAPSTGAIASVTEALGMTAAELDLVRRNPPAVNGIARPRPLQVPSESVGAFMRTFRSPKRSREPLSYDEALAVVATTLVDPSRSRKVKLKAGVSRDHCNADDRVFDPKLDDKALDAVGRLLRLLRHLPYSPAELDVVLAAAGGAPTANTTDATLVNLVALERLRVRLSMTAEEVAALFRDFQVSDVSEARPDATTPLYRRLFLTRADGSDDSIPEAYRTGKGQLDLMKEGARISAALKIAPCDFPELLAGTFPGDTNLVVSFENLSKLYRVIRLFRTTSARSLKEFLVTLSRLGDPLASVRALGVFLDRIEIIERFTLAADDLLFLDDASAKLPLDLTALDVALDALIEQTRRQLLAEGAPSATDADARQIVLETGAWIGPLSTWACQDPGKAVGLGALPKTTRESIIDKSSADHAKSVAAAARYLTLVRVTRVTAADALRFPELPPVLEVAIEAPKFGVIAVFEMVERARELGGISAFADYVLIAQAATTSLSDLAKKLAELMKVGPTALEASWSVLDADAKRRLDPAFLAQLSDVHRATQALGVTPSGLASLATTWPGPDEAAGVRTSVRSKLGADAWFASSAAIQNALRERKRDSLVDYLVGNTPPGGQPAFATAADLDAHYFIDVQMGACRDTSRIVQAASAVQTLVQRVLLGLEPDVVPDAGDVEKSALWSEWVWRKRYRLWQANRLVFLYPENFLRIGNRPNASPLFDEFAKRVGENAITDENVAAALGGYLQKLEPLARLDYLAMDYYAPPQTDDPGLVGVVARSASAPHTHYYRRFALGSWTPWEEVAVGPGISGLILGQGAKRAWIAWPTATNQAHPEQNVPDFGKNVSVDENDGSGLAYVRYGWTVRDERGIWSDSRVTSASTLMTPRDKRSFVMEIWGDYPTALSIRVLLYTWQPIVGGKAELAQSVARTSMMDIVTDSIGTNLQQRVAGLDGIKVDDKRWQEPRWQEHYNEFRAAVSDPFDDPLHPWVNLHFDDNRMTAGGDTAVTITVPASDSKVDPRDLLAPLAPVWTTKPSVPGNLTDDEVAPLGNAFVVSGGRVPAASSDDADGAIHWSAMFISPNVRSRTASKSVAKALAGDNRYLMVPAYHPWVTELLGELKLNGLPGIYNAKHQEDPSTLGRAALDYFSALALNATNVVAFTDSVLVGATARQTTPVAKEAIDFDPIAPYGLYNYEIFIFAPVLVAQLLSGQRQFAEAQRFYHHVFNPLSTDSSEGTKRYWVAKPFRQNQSLDDVVTELEDAAGSGSQDYTNPWRDIEKSPFNAHLIASKRKTAYQKFVVRSYLDNLLAWGDSLYRRLTREDVDDALPIYELAEKILGDRPTEVPALRRRTDLAFDKPDNWLGGSNVLVAIEAFIHDAQPAHDREPAVFLPLVQTGDPVRLYFRVPPNEELLGYWDAVSTRLRNIRACRGLDGAPVSLSLETAPIDPQALVDAAARGVSTAEAIAMASSSPPPFRFRVIVSKAQECAREISALSAAMLGALEKRDAEQLATVRSQFEEPVLKATREVKVQQQDIAAKEVDALRSARAIAQANADYYDAREYMNDLETAAFALNVVAGILDTAGAVLDLVSGGLQLIPDVTVGVAGFGGTPLATVQYGGSNVSGSAAKWAHGLTRLAGLVDRVGSAVATQASYRRRKDDWEHQASQSLLEADHIDAQIAAAQLRVKVAQAELTGHDALENAWRQVDVLLREKFSNADLYDLYAARLAELHRRACEQAFRLASLAHQCLKFELGTAVAGDAPPTRATEQFRGVKGLLAGEALGQYLRSLETRYYETPAYASVITQHVPLSQVAPHNLASFIETGDTKEITIPAWWFTRLDPSLTNRRIRTLSVSIPCVGGAYANVNAKVRCTSGGSRIDTITLSHANQDFGWDMSTRAEQYVPFEGVVLDGVNGTKWTVTIPTADGASDVDRQTVTDIVFHIEYGMDLGSNQVTVPPLVFLFDVARSQPAAWRALRSEQRACSIAPKPLLPRFLRGHRIKAVRSHGLLEAGGVVSHDKLEVDLSEEIIKVHQTANTVVDWGSVRGLLVLLDVEPYSISR